MLQVLDAAADREKFQVHVPAMLATLGSALNAQDEATAQEAVEIFIEVRVASCVSMIYVQ